MSGEVIAVGEKVTRFKVGDRVAGLTGYGAFAEEVIVPEHNLLLLPGGMSDEKAAAFMMVYGTSYYALKRRAKIQTGESLLVLGASGGVGRATVELGKAMGARVIAAASSAQKLAFAEAAGADELIDDTEQALRAMAWNGRHLIIGFATGEISKIPANLMLLKSCSVVGVFWDRFTQREPQASAQNMTELMKLYAEGKIDPKISEVFDFEDYAKALGALTERRAVGKVGLKVGL
jgi:NADPH:quinone reductase-like Zn-dependent oxidoreductase